MRAVSLPRFLPALLNGRTVALALFVLLVLMVLFVAGVTDVAAADMSSGTDPTRPFRW